MRMKGEAMQQLRLAVMETGRTVCFMGGDSPDNSGQNEAARMNAEIAKEMWGQYQKTYLPMEQQFAKDAGNYATPDRYNQEAADASVSVQQSFDKAQQANERKMQSMGVNPGSAQYQASAQELMMKRAATDASQQNAARRNVENMGWARKQDAISIGKGMPGQASASMAQAGNQYAAIASQNAAQNSADAQGLGNAVGGTAAAYSIGKDFFADGGLADKRELRLAGGGLAGNPRMQQVMSNNAPTMPVSRGGLSNEATTGLNAIKTYRNAKNVYDIGQKMVADPNKALAGPKTGTELPAGMQPSGAETFPVAEGAPIGETPLAASEAELAAGEQGILEATATSTAEASAAEMTGAAATEAVATAAATEAAAGATATAATEAAVGAAAATGPVGWVGLAAAGLAAAIFGGKKDGGEIRRTDMTGGGAVSGPGTETSDSIPARLSDGEYVINAESVKMIGVPTLDKINQYGLNKRYGGLDNARRAR